MREVKLTKWRDITHEHTEQFRPENARKPLNIPIHEEKVRPVFLKKTEKSDSRLFMIIATLPFTVIILWTLYEIFFN
jgi:hypothetical protein